jgi:hypothetical protein
MICPPCQLAADSGAERVVPEPSAALQSFHVPTICRDFMIQPHGYTCQHGLAGLGRENPYASRGASPIPSQPIMSVER